jgi:enamine deaminase RidA (YjgF/YER057c/UK114 family)
MVSALSPQPPSAESRLRALDIELPPTPNPLGAYVESVQTGNMLYLSGVLPVAGHEAKYTGRLGRDVNLEQGRQAARLATLNVLALVRNHLGSLDKVARVVKLTTYIVAEPDFGELPKVADASSELLRDVFGSEKLPVRMVLGVASLPLGVPVVVETVFELVV